MEEGLITGDQDLSSSEKRMLLRIRNRFVANFGLRYPIGRDQTVRYPARP